jgi:hypothetical protein
MVRTPQFKAWFGDWEHDPENASKVVDENGEPLVVWHGTKKWELDGVFQNISKNTITPKRDELGIHFGTLYQAQSIIKNSVPKSLHTKLKPFYLNIHNIKRVYDTNSWNIKSFTKIYEILSLIQNKEFENIQDVYEDLKDKGIDGFVYYNEFEGDGDSYIVLDSNQIKLADGTNTTFDPWNPDIRYEDGGEMSDDYILQAAERIANELVRLGYDVTTGAYAKTAYGHSKYLYANYGNRSMDNFGDGIKIRVSDHSVSNPYRVSEEVHVFPNKDSMQQIIDKAVKDVDIRLRKELFEPKDKIRRVEDVLVVGENEIDPETDEILAYEGISKRGGKKYRIKRVTEKKYVTMEYIQKPDIRYAEGGVTSYQQRVENNFKQMGTESTEWTTVPVTGIVDTKDDKGKEVSLPTFDFTTTKGYKTPNTMYRSDSFNVCCELCGKQIKRVYWIKNDKRKYILSVGSECVTHFEEGKSGVENVREYKIELAKKYNYDIRKYEQLIEKVHNVRRKDFNGKYYYVWEISILDESMQFVADDPKTPILKKLKQYLIERIDFMGKAPVSRDEDKFRWSVLYASMPGFVEYDEELKYAKNEKEVESLNRRVLNFYTRQKEIWTPVLEMLEQYFSLVDVSGLSERFHDVKSAYLAELAKIDKSKTTITDEEKATETVVPKMTVKEQIVALEMAKKYVKKDPVKLKELEEQIAGLKTVLKYTI